MDIKILKIQIRIDSNLSSKSAEYLRGFLGRLFWENPYVHHHDANGSLIYQYPRIQYKVIENSFFLIGFQEGEEILKKLFFDLMQLNLEGKWQQIIEKTIESSKEHFGISEQIKAYRFLTPWLALNEKNYDKYQKFGTWIKRKELLGNILVGNILSIAKSIGYTVPEMIRVDIIKLKEVRIRLKEVPMIGFLGDFSINFNIPDYWGIGKSVSRGFGTVKKLEP